MGKWDVTEVVTLFSLDDDNLLHLKKGCNFVPVQCIHKVVRLGQGSRYPWLAPNILLPLTLECWGYRHIPPGPGLGLCFFLCCMCMGVLDLRLCMCTTCRHAVQVEASRGRWILRGDCGKPYNIWVSLWDCNQTYGLWKRM